MKTIGLFFHMILTQSTKLKLALALLAATGGFGMVVAGKSLLGGSPIRGREALERLVDEMLDSPHQLQAHEKYMNRRVEAEGAVTSIAPVYDDPTGECVYVWVKSGMRHQLGGFFNIDVYWVCLYPKTSTTELIDLKIGQRIRVNGKFTNWVKAPGELVYRFILEDPSHTKLDEVLPTGDSSPAA